MCKSCKEVDWKTRNTNRRSFQESTQWKRGKEKMAGLRVVLDNVGCFPKGVRCVDGDNRGEAGLSDGHKFVSCVHNCLQFLEVLCRPVAIPSCGAFQDDPFYGASIEMNKSPIGHAKFLRK